MAIVLSAVFTACGADKQTSLGAGEENPGVKTDVTQNGNENSGLDLSDAAGEDNIPAGSNNQNPSDINGNADNIGENGDKLPGTVIDRELLQSASVDLDADGVNEQVEALKITLAHSDDGTAGRIEGRLSITDAGNVKEVVFWNKDNDLSGIMTGLQFEDMDGDGAKDIFVIVPGYGASFTYSNCFVYSYMKDKSCIFSSDNELADFIGGFRFTYENNGNKLGIINDQYGFTTEIAVEESDFTTPSEEVMYEYADRSWIEPTSVDISETSKLALVKDSGAPVIKVPLPIFGMATVNMIGEIDLYYSIDNNFKLVLERCEVIDFSGNKKIKAGSFNVIQ